MQAQSCSQALFAMTLVACHCAIGGCQGVPNPTRPAVAELPQDYAKLVSLANRDARPRGQKPDSLGILPISASEPSNSDTRAGRIRAVVNGEAILEEEVLASAAQQLVGVKTEKDKAEILATKLQELIDREVVIQDAIARLGSRANGKIIKELEKFANQQFETQWLHKMMRANKYEDEEEFKKFLLSAGMPVDMFRRQWVRNLMAMEYMRSRIEPTLNKVSQQEIEAYFDKHPEEFKIEDSVEWQDIFITKAKHPTPQAARQFAETLLARIKKGEDFVQLAKQHDNGDSSLREDARGLGTKRGEIQPAEAEPILFAMSTGQAGMVELQFGYHLVKVMKREQAGLKPFDEEVQKEIRDKIKNDIFQREMKRMVNDLKRRAIIVLSDQ